MENHSKQISIVASAQLASSPVMTLCQNFIANYDNYKDVDAARQILLEEFRNTQCYGTNFCGFVSPMGFMKITATDNAISHCEFTSELCPITPRGILAEAALWLSEYFAGKNPQWTVRTIAEGSVFSSAVWSEIRAIPFGKTVSYGEIRDRLSKKFPDSKFSAQAVGGAVGRNKLAILCPCHRVIGSDGSLTGYAWGLEIKKALLELERNKENLTDDMHQSLGE